MTFRFITRSPRPPLSAFVESLWFAQGQVPYRRERILPNGRPVLIINLGSPFRTSIGASGSGERIDREAWIVGTLSEYLTNEPLRETNVVGAVFHPWGLGSLFGLPTSEMADRTEAADAVCGRRIAFLREHLGEEPSASGKLAIMEAGLSSCLAMPEDHTLAIAAFAARRLEGTARPGIGCLSDEMGISRKHLNVVFKRHVGLSPKAFSRVCRLRHALQALANGEPSLGELALDHGYYDQAHFNHDFAAFSGLPPTAYLDRRRRFLAGGDDPSGLFVPEGWR